MMTDTLEKEMTSWLLQLQELIQLPFLIQYQNRIIALPYVIEDTYSEHKLKLLLQQQDDSPLRIEKFQREVYMLVQIKEDLSIITYQHSMEAFLYQKKYNFLLKSMAFVYLTLTKQHLHISLLMDEKRELETPVVEEELIQIREEENYHISYINELYIRNCIHRGDVKQLKKAYENFRHAGSFGTLDKKDTLRNKKNQLIPVVTLASRAAIEGGLPQEQAYKLSDLYIQSIEDCKRIENTSSISIDILTDFTKRVKQQKRKNLSKNIYLCQEYIYEHLYEKISLSILAEYLHMNPSYLSTKFKEETGTKLTTYIQMQKIMEAKQLLLMSKYQISEIYTLLNFTDQSHFNRVFKQIEGITPNQFKESYLLK